MSDSVFKLPRLYPIIDRSCFAGKDDLSSVLVAHARELIGGGASILQYRNKVGTAREILGDALVLRAALADSAQLIINDRADLCLAVDFNGVHVGQDDLPPYAVRMVVGKQKIVGFSTHNPVQVKEADTMPIDYVAIGPVFTTGSKANPDPVIGLEGVGMARRLTRKPLVAIGGITRDNCRSVIEAGADSVAVIGDLLKAPRRSVEEFLSILG